MSWLRFIGAAENKLSGSDLWTWTPRERLKVVWLKGEKKEVRFLTSQTRGVKHWGSIEVMQVGRVLYTMPDYSRSSRPCLKNSESGTTPRREKFRGNGRPD